MTDSPRVRRWAAAIVLFVLALATRWPVRATVLEEFDSANYALAVLELNLRKAQPHPPGYIFYVGATRAANALVGDPVAALVMVSVVSGAVSVVLLLELLVPVLGLLPATAACLATLAASQVWLQQARPMQEAFALAWMLGVALALVRAVENGGFRPWCAAMAVVGLSAGAKQVLPIFFMGLLAWAARAAWRKGGLRWIAAGVGAALVASLTWFVPLSVHCGSPLAYIEWAMGQVAWQREHDAAAFALGWARVAQQARVTFVTAAGPAWSAPFLWALALAGAAVVARRREAVWLLWLLVPLVVVRMFLLGLWPRFDVYYLPLVIALAVAGVGTLLARLVTVAALRIVIGGALLAGWCGVQALHVVPTLAALHRGPSPTASALEAIAARCPPEQTLLLTRPSTLQRQVEYYARRHGFRHQSEDEVSTGTLREARHVVKLHADDRVEVSASWMGEGAAVGRWSLAVPHAEELTPTRDFWNVSAFELTGAYVALRRFRMDESFRTFAAPESAVVVFRAPREGALVRLTFRTGARARFVIDQRRSIEWDGVGATYELALGPEELPDGRARIDVIPECGGPECLELLEVRVVRAP
jgi:hypothetical protein